MILRRSLFPVASVTAGFCLILLPTARGADADATAAAARASGDANKALLRSVDQQIEQLEALRDRAPTEPEKDELTARIRQFKTERSELRKNYAQDRYDQLKAEVKAEYDKAVSWPHGDTDRLASAGRAEDTEVRADTAATNAAVATTATDVDAYKLDPTTQNKADAKAALTKLDEEIARLQARADDLPKGEARNAAEERVKALKQRRNDLAGDFRKARYDALMSDIKAEWHKLTH